MNGKQAKRIRELAYFILAGDDEADPIYREYEVTESRTKHTQFGPIRVTTPLRLQRDCIRDLYQVLKHNYKT